MIGFGLIIILLAGVALLIFLAGVTMQHNKTVSKPNLDFTLVRTQWREITQQMQSAKNMKNALIEADKLLDYVLRGRGYRGTTMAERLKSAESSFSHKELVWRAHKLRNQMVHEFTDVVPQQIEHSVNDLGQAIRDLGVQI